MMELLMAAGYRACIISASRLGEVQWEYRSYTETKTWRSSPHLQRHMFDFRLPAWMPEYGSVIIVAAPVAPVRLEFAFDGKTITVDAPPLSTDYQKDQEIFGGIITSAIEAGGYRLAVADLPTKLIASHGGLLVNGYNNMGFIEGMGSFFRLAAYYSDLPAEGDNWQGHAVSPRCQDCGICLSHCPTGCLAPGRYDVSRCLSLLSKEPFDFPDWVDNRWHNAIIGCRVCQLSCPLNLEIVRHGAIGESFDEGESRSLLDGVPFKLLDPATRNKLERFHLDGYYDILPRNLRLLMAQ